MKKLILTLALVSCGHPLSEDAPQPSTKDIQKEYFDASNRAITQFLDHSRIVDRGQDGSAQGVGDSLIFSGLALFGLPCDLGSVIENQIISEIDSLQGGLMRHPVYEPNDASLDGALGLYFGIADRISRCSGSIEKWTPAIKKHMDFVDSNSQRLNPKSNSILTKEFDYVLHLMAYKMGVRNKPSNDTKLLLGLEIGEWARATMVAKKGCFRINLGLLALKTIEMLGESHANIVKNNFCDATKDSQLPTTDHYCGRTDMKQWIQDFKYNVWEYRHQRCGLFETPDAGGMKTPAIDYLVALRTVYQPLALPTLVDKSKEVSTKTTH